MEDHFVPSTESLPETFVEQVKDVLAHLYEYPYLQTHPLALALRPSQEMSGRERMRFLRTLVLETIESLNPGRGVDLRSPRARSYNMLSLHYVEGHTMHELVTRLALSERQLYRDLRQAERDLAALLWSRHATPPASEAPTVAQTQEQLLLQEVGQLVRPREAILLHTLAQEALEGVQRLAASRDIMVQSDVEGHTIASLDPLLARQALLLLLSAAVQQARQQSSMLLAVSSRQGHTRARVTFTAGPESPPSPAFPATVVAIVGRLGGRYGRDMGAGGQVQLTISLPDRAQAVVLVIDDNQGLQELFRRYLAEEDYCLLPAGSGEEGLRVAAECLPDVVVLDVMMPGQDGWAVLRHLRTNEATRTIPVIVCSVLDDPALALSFGATDFMAKPVSRMQLLTVLARSLPAARPRRDPISPAGN
jgi:CheY-like chemotaxis protein